jgi:hypothetical protein
MGKVAHWVPKQDRIIPIKLGILGYIRRGPPKIQSLVDNEDVRLPVIKMNPQICYCGNGNVLNGLVFATVWMNNDPTSIVINKQSIAACNS